MEKEKKLSFAVIYWWIFILFGIGLLLMLFADKEERVSMTENRTLAGFPEFSASSVFSGEFTAGIENYLTDGMIARDDIIGLSESILHTFNRTNDMEARLLTEREMRDEVQGILPSDENSPAPDDTGTTDPTADDSSEPSDEITPPAETPGSDITTDIEGYGLWLELPDGTYNKIDFAYQEHLDSVCHMLNSFRSFLPEDGNVFYTNIPPTTTGNILWNSKEYIGWYENFDQGMAGHLDEGVHMINTPAVLESHLLAGEHIYFLSDHHWTPLAASYLVDECMRIQGVPTVPYDEYAYKVNTYENQDHTTKDDLCLLYPLENVKGQWFPSGKPGGDLSLIYYDLDTYYAYLGGDTRVWAKYDTGFSTGRKALVIGDSFSNTFLPYLLPYYDEIHKIDARHQDALKDGGSISELMTQYGIDDVYIMVSYYNGVRTQTSFKNLEIKLYGHN